MRLKPDGGDRVSIHESAAVPQRHKSCEREKIIVTLQKIIFMEKQVNEYWDKVYVNFKIAPDETKKVWDNISDIITVINWLGQNGINRILFPGGGWDDFEWCERPYEKEAITIKHKGSRDQIIKAKRLTLNILSRENPKWNYFILETGDDANPIFETNDIAEDLILLNGVRYAPFTDDEDELYPDEDARKINRQFGGKAVFTSCGTPIDRAEMDVHIGEIPYNEFTTDEFRYVIEQAMTNRFNLEYVHQGIKEIKQEYKESHKTPLATTEKES